MSSAFSISRTSGSSRDPKYSISVPEMQEAAEYQVHTPFAVRRNAFRDLFGCADQLRAEPVVVLHQVFKR